MTSSSAMHSPAPSAHNPYACLPQVPSFHLTSTSVTDGQPLPVAQLSKMFGVPGGEDLSPQLSWSGFPADTQSFVVSMYDPQAPTGSGFWHWVVADIPAGTTSLPAGAGALYGTLPGGAFVLGADAGVCQYVGGAPPAGSGVHEYYLTVTALSVAKTGIDQEESAAYLGFIMSGKTLARATLICPTPAPAA